MQPNYQPAPMNQVPYGQQPQMLDPYGQPIQPNYGQQQQYNQQLGAQPVYGQPVYGQPPYGQQMYGQPVMASQQMGGQPMMYGVTPVVQTVIQNADGYQFPVTLRCPYCSNTARTMVDSRVGDQTICAGFLILLLCWPLFWLPCCMDDCKDKVHLCGSCGKEVGRKRYQMC